MEASMHVADILSPEDIMLGFGARSPKDLLRQLARGLEPRARIDSAAIYRALQKRELIGPTNVKGVMLPHAPMDNLLWPIATFVQLSRPLDYHAHDGEDVHLVFALLWPADDMRGLLQGLKCVCRSLREQTGRERLRRARSKEEIFRILEGADIAADGRWPD
jgi:nitrogen PTS system EIIA component